MFVASLFVFVASLFRSLCVSVVYTRTRTRLAALYDPLPAPYSHAPFVSQAAAEEEEELGGVSAADLPPG
jgi:hypothetical protein